MYSGTDSSKGSESKRRARVLKEKFVEVAEQNNKKWTGWRGEVMVSELDKGVMLLQEIFTTNKLS